MKLEPLQDRIIIKQLEAEDISKGGIFIPDVAKERPVRGIIIETGEGRYENGTLIPMKVKSGDTVFFGKYSGTELKYNDEEYLIMRESDILAIIHND